MHIDELHKRLYRDLNGKSDRDCIILFASWIDHLLTRKCRVAPDVVGKVSRTLAQRIDEAFRAGWIDNELRDDLHVVRKLRNEFAHSIDVSSLSDAHLQEVLRSLRVPAREYYDWDMLRVAATTNGGIVFYAGLKPTTVSEELREGSIRFHLGISVILCVLLSSLRLEFATDDPDESVVPTVSARLMALSNDEASR